MVILARKFLILLEKRLTIGIYKQSQPKFTRSKLTKEKLEQGVRYVQS